MNRRQWTMLLGLAAIWGGSYALTRVALDDGVPWAWIAFLRVALGAAVMTAIALRILGAASLRQRPRWTFAVGAAQVGIPLLLIPWGQRQVPSGLAGILVATAPLFTALLARRYVPDTALGRHGLIGVGLGLVGVVLLFGVDLSADAELALGGLAIVLAALGYGIGATLSRRTLTGVDPLAVSATTLLWATLITGAVALPTGLPAVPSAGTIVALVVLGAFGTGIAWLIFFTLVAEVGPSRAMFVTYLAPGFALVYGASFFAEPVTAGAIVGIVLIVGGSLLGGRRGPSRGLTSPPAPS